MARTSGRRTLVGLALVLLVASGCSSADDVQLPPAARSAVPRTTTRTPLPSPVAPAPPTLRQPTRLSTAKPPPAPLPPWPARAAITGLSCDQIVAQVNGAAARCAQPGDGVLQAQSVAGGDRTVGLTDDDQVVYVQRGMSADDTYLVAMHERGHQEMIQRCSTWTCGDMLIKTLGTTRRSWNAGSYFDRVVEVGASTWARCHGADNPRYGYRLSCQDLEKAFTAETAARKRAVDEQDLFDAAWRSYHQAYEKYKIEYDAYRRSVEQTG